MTTTIRSRSVGHMEPADEYIEWLVRRWDELSADQKKTAVIDVRVHDDFHMIGLRYTELER